MAEKTDKEISPNIRATFERAYEAMERAHYDQAISLLHSVLNAEPGFLKARKILRLVQLRRFKSGGSATAKKFGAMFTGMGSMMKGATSRDPIQTMAEAEKMLNDDPTSGQALSMLATAAEDAGFLQTAAWTLESIRERHPKDIPLLRRMAKLYMLEGLRETDKARQAYDMILKLKPNDSEAMKGAKDAVAVGSIKKGGWEEAKSYRDVIADKDVAVSLEQASRVVKSDDMITNQIAEIEALVEKEPENLVHYRKLGDLYTQNNEFDKALQFMRTALERTGGDPSLETEISDTTRRKFEFQIAALKEELTKTNSPAVKTQIEDLEKAKQQFLLADCESRRNRYPNELEIRFELGLLYLRANRIDDAIKEFQLAQRNPRRRLQTLNYIGQCFAQKGILDLAADQFKKAIAEHPVLDNLKKDILYNLGTVYERMKKDDLAAEQFKKIYEADLGFRDVAQKIEAYYKKKSAEGDGGTASAPA